MLLDSFEKLGFNVNFRAVPRDTMYSKFCSVPKNQAARSARATGWLKDFADPQTMIDPIFNGKNIVPTGNVNWRAAGRSEAEQGDGRRRGA